MQISLHFIVRNALNFEFPLLGKTDFHVLADSI